MTKEEISTFIKEMAAIGDNWTVQQVLDVYGDKSLAEALKERKASVGTFINNIAGALHK